jgi:hypothetical protein
VKSLEKVQLNTTHGKRWIYVYDHEIKQQSSQWKKSKLKETVKGRTGEELSQEHAGMPSN